MIQQSPAVGITSFKKLELNCRNFEKADVYYKGYFHDCGLGAFSPPFIQAAGQFFMINISYK